MNKFHKFWRLLTIAALLVSALNLTALPATPAHALSSNLVITQVYGGAGCSTAGCSAYKNDYIVLHNLGSTSQSINGWSVQYYSATGTATWSGVHALPNATIAAGQYYLIAESSSTNGVNPLPTPDATGTIAMSATAGKVALVNNTTALTCSGTACASVASIIDLVGYGATANTYEGSGPAPAPSTANAIFRGNNGCTETDNNSADFSASAAAPVNSTSSSACVVNPNLSINDVSLAEGNGGTTTFTFTVSLSALAPAGGVTFDIATADDVTATAATAGSDYVAKTLTSQTIPAGSDSYTFDVTVNGDTTFEDNETFLVNVSNVTGATVSDGQGLGTIQNDDAALPVLSVTDVTKAEGNSGPTTFGFVVNLDVPAPVGGVSFDITTADDTATVADNDYVANTPATVTIPEGSSSYNFDVTVNGDTNIELTETFFVNVTNVVGATVSDNQGLGTITNDDAATPSLTINDVTHDEGNSSTTTYTFTVSLDIPALAGGVTFDLDTADVTATAGTDYVANSADAVNIPEGSSSATFDVTVNGDTTFEPDETFNVNVSNLTGATLGDGTGVGTITNDDAAPANLSITDVTLAEGNTGTTTFGFVVSLDAAAPAGGVSFDITTADNTATVADNDYVANTPATVTIPAGNYTYNFDVTVNGDWTNEPNETFFVNVSNVTGALVADGQGLGTITNDDAYTPTYTIQGSGPATTLSGTYTTQGVVVGDYEGGVSPQIRGFYIQDQTGDADVATSDGLFVYNGSNDNVALGDLVRVTGTVSDYQGQTQISATSISVLSSGNTLTPTDITLPFASAAVEEQYEGMLVRVPQTLFVTEIYQLGRFNQITMSGTGKLYQPTNIVLPGAPANAMQAANDLNKIVVDDASQSQNPDPILFGRGGLPLSASNTLRGGDTIDNLVGVFTYTWGGNSASPNAYRIRPINAMGGGIPNFVPANARPATPPVVGGTLKAVGMNLLNYFNSFTSCYPSGTAGDCRGANNAEEFTRQSDKAVSAIITMNADVIGIAEMENDGYDASSAIQDLVNKLNLATAPGTYTFINPDTLHGDHSLGTDAIKVGILYKPARVTPVGTTAVLNSTAFVNGGDTTARNRPSLLQAFQTADGERFLFNVNHLKSKGSCPGAGTNPGNEDIGDGQSCWSLVRTNAVNALLTWFATDPTGTGDTDILIVGDLNSYAKEDPIRAFETAGFTNMVNYFGGDSTYSYVFDGQWGYLDHAIGSPSLLAQVTGAEDWHINSDEPSVLDYNTEFKTAGQIISLYSPDQYRISDHDPVVTGLNLDASAPTVVSSVRAGSNPTNAASVDFTVTFSEAVTNVGTGDFDLTLGGGVTGASVTNVAAVTSSVYTVTVDTGTGDGSIRLNIKASPTIQDLIGNPLVGPYLGGEAYAIDKTAPTVVSSVRAGANPTNAASVPFTVTFSEDVTGVDSPDFSLNNAIGSITGATIGAISGSGTTYTVNVNTGSGDGTLGLNVRLSAIITDAAGNNLGNLPFTSGEEYTIDKTAPIVDTFTVTTPTTNINIPISTLSASDAAGVGVTGYMVTETATSPAAGASGWTGTIPATYTVARAGTYTLYPWAKDAVGNVSALFGTPRTVIVTANIDALIAGASQGTYNLSSGGSTRQSYAGVNDGPVKVTSLGGAPILAAQRILYTGYGTQPTSFVEMMGLPDSQVGTTYWFPWYKNVGDGVDTQLRIGNVSASTATVHIYIAGVEVTGSPFTLSTSGAGQSQRLSFALNDGPVKIVSDHNIVATERLIYFNNGAPTSFSEMMGLPDSQLSKTYWFPWYKNVGEVDTQIRIGNVSASTATVHIYIAGVEVTGSPFTLTTTGAGQSQRLSFPVNDGPVKIVSDQNIVASQRILYYAGGVPTSFVETMGIPDGQLSTTQWFPWYKSDGIVDTQLRIGNVSGTTATVHVYIAGVEVTGSPFTLTATGAGQSQRLSFAGVNDGPVKIVSDQNVIASERLIYFNNGVPVSFSEMMSMSDNALSPTYLLPWYKNVGEIDTQLRFGVP